LIILAARKASEGRGQRGLFSLKELDWFYKNAYNCAVNGCENWDSKQIISMTESCVKVVYSLIMLIVVFDVVSERYGFRK
jgi:hypothetical protein